MTSSGYLEDTTPSMAGLATANGTSANLGEEDAGTILWISVTMIVIVFLSIALYFLVKVWREVRRELRKDEEQPQTSTDGGVAAADSEVATASTPADNQPPAQDENVPDSAAAAEPDNTVVDNTVVVSEKEPLIPPEDQSTPQENKSENV